MAEKLVFICSDGHKLSYNLWLPEDGNIKAFVQILHGMAEYSDRYKRFAKFLNSNGYAVFAGDHRGHGDTAENGELGWFAKEDGWNRISSDAFELGNYIVSKYSAPRTFLFGHSMGSFLARTVMVQHPDFYSGVVVMGTSASKGLLGKMGKLICKSQIRKEGQKSAGELMNKLSFGSYNKAFEPTSTDFDWLSRDEAEVEKYVKDPLCGFICTNGFFLDLLTGIEFANDSKNAMSIPKDLPVLIISGEADPVGDMGKGIKKVHKLYSSAGITDLSLKLYPQARHELLNEINREEVSKDILNWFEARI